MEPKELIENFEEDLTCSICLGQFTDPVTTKCGHNFCRDCLLQCYEQADATLTCPECRDVIRYSDIVPSKDLQNLSITGKTLGQHLLQSQEFLTSCDQHGEREKLFCEQDQKLICDSCTLTQEHKDHQVHPLQMAADKCKKKLQETRNMLQRKKEACEEAIKELRKAEAYFKGQQDTNHLKELIRSEYHKMHEFLWNEEKESLELYDQEVKDKLTKAEENEACLSKRIQHMKQRRLEIEESFDNAPLEMLQDSKDILERNEELLLQKPEIVSFTYIMYSMTGLTEILQSYQRDILLDNETDSFHLIVPEGFKHFKYECNPKDQPDNQKDSFVIGLGAQTFTSGIHYWEVDVRGQTEWVLGICEDSVSQNGNVPILFKDVTAIIGLKDENEMFFWSPSNSCCQLHINKVGMLLNYEEGHVSFYDIEGQCVLFSFTNLVFQGPVCPFFSTSLTN